MTRVKFCGLSRTEDIEIANELKPDYIGFVFFSNSKRYVTPDKALKLRANLHESIRVVGVFLDEQLGTVSELLNSGVIDIAQLHGHEAEDYVSRLKDLTGKPIIKAFNINSINDAHNANTSSADYILLDSETAGSGTAFNWDLVKGIERPYFLAGGLNLCNISDALKINPYAVDVSSGIETDGFKDADKMRKFISIVRQHTDA